jgi:hypothetical protein
LIWVDYNDYTWEKAHMIEKSIPKVLINQSRMRFCRYNSPNGIELFSMHQTIALYEITFEGIYLAGSCSASLG